MTNPQKEWTDESVAEHNRRVAEGFRRNRELAGHLPITEQTVGESCVSDMAERELHCQIIQELKLRGWLYFHGSTAHKTSRTIGEPDFQVYAPDGRQFCVECKSKDGKLSIAQQAVQRWLAKLGHETYVIRTIDEFRQICDRTNTGEPRAELNE